MHVLLRAADDSSADEDDQRGLNNAAVAHIIADPVLHLTRLHADIGCRSGAFVSIPAAIGQMIAEMAEVRERHGVAMSRVSVGIDADSAHLHQHALDIEAALRDACRTAGFPCYRPSCRWQCQTAGAAQHDCPRGGSGSS